MSIELVIKADTAKAEDLEKFLELIGDKLTSCKRYGDEAVITFEEK